jgi:hypothetical protein
VKRFVLHAVPTKASMASVVAIALRWTLGRWR